MNLRYFFLTSGLPLASSVNSSDSVEGKKERGEIAVWEGCSEKKWEESVTTMYKAEEMWWKNQGNQRQKVFCEGVQFEERDVVNTFRILGA